MEAINTERQEREAEQKTEATLMALLAIRGHQVHRTVTGYLVASNHGFTRHCASLDSLQAFARQTGALK